MLTLDIDFRGDVMIIESYPFKGSYYTQDVCDLLIKYFWDDCKPFYVHEQLAIESMRWELDDLFDALIEDLIDYHDLTPFKIEKI